MTPSQAISAVEQTLTDCKIPDKFGGYLVGIEAGSAIRKVMGQEWDECFVKLMDGRFTPEQYVERSRQLIDHFMRFHWRRRLEKLLEEKRGA